MECFFLHCQTVARLYADHPVIWRAPKVTTGKNRVSSGNKLQKYGSRGLIYEAAGYGAMGTVKEVEQVNVYDFYHYLAFCRDINNKE